MTPCQDPANNPDDWFISSNGRQYRDDELVPDKELENVAWEARGLYVEGREDMLVRAALVRRRHAKDKCFTCPARMACLQLAFDPQADNPDLITHGTFGGYFEEERAKMTGEVIRRRQRDQE